ncbi:MAG: NUDIX domain-containing protein [Bacteroidales bacterium]|nr:NUDIX domain-containing protein [Bacteroidales bacterium]
MHILEKFGFCPVCGSAHFKPVSEKSMLCENCGFEYFVNPSAATVAFILNSKGELLVERRKREPAKGTLDLPGGFADMDETAEQGVAREVLEETGLTVNHVQYLFSLPNKYRYSGIDIPTLDMFFRCEVTDVSTLRADDDAAEVLWVPLHEIHTEQFGLRSIRQGLIDFIKQHT